MGKATLVIMAAGIGSRFGGGIKQLEPVGPNGEIIMDYSIYDALEAGFDKVVFVIRKDLEKDFREVFGNRIAEKIRVEYAFQELDAIPEKYLVKAANRKKPWGTGQAILCCKNLVKEPFVVINADDYYGKEAYRNTYEFLTGMDAKENGDKLLLCMAGFVLKNTLSENGGVTRGICKTDSDHMLTDIVETKNVMKVGDRVQIANGEDRMDVDADSEVSMNMWGLVPEIFEILENGFEEFLEVVDEKDITAEYLFPTIVDGLLKTGEIEVKVLPTQDKWFGVTYKQDKESVVQSVRELVEQGLYD